jgi:hypothetical protein
LQAFLCKGFLAKIPALENAAGRNVPASAVRTSRG